MDKYGIRSQLIAGFAASLAMVSVGFNNGWASPSLPKLLADDSDILITSDQSSWIVSFFLIGSLCGPFASTAIVDRFGRKLTLLITVIPNITSCILIGVGQNYLSLIIARFIGGFGTGLSIPVLLMYLGEIADDKIRGALGTILNVMINFGILLTYCVGPWVSRVALAGLGGAMPLIFGLIFIWMPESPYYLIMKNKTDEAEKSLRWLKGSESVSDDLKKVQDSVEFDRKNAATMKDLVFVPGNRKALFIALGLGAALHLSGITAILAYGSLIFEASGSTLDSNVSVIIIGLVQLLSGILTVLTVDLAGRRPLLLISISGTILFLSGEALYFYFQSIGTDVSGISWLPVTAIVGYVIFFANGLGCLPYVVISEIFPCNVKGLATTIATVFSSLSAAVVSKMYQIVADAYGIHVSFLGFVICTVFSLFFVYFCLPETKQRSFQSIQDELHKITESKVKLNV